MHFTWTTCTLSQPSRPSRLLHCKPSGTFQPIRIKRVPTAHSVSLALLCGLQLQSASFHSFPRVAYIDIPYRSDFVSTSVTNSSTHSPHTSPHPAQTGTLNSRAFMRKNADEGGGCGMSYKPLKHGRSVPIPCPPSSPNSRNMPP